MLDIHDIKRRIASRAAEFLEMLFGDRLRGDRTDTWRVGTHGSLAITLQNGELVWYDHENCEGGDSIDLWCRERGGDIGSAIKDCAAWAGVLDDGSHIQRPPKVPPPVRKDDHVDTRPSLWPHLGEEKRDVWWGGVTRLDRDPEARQRIAEWRGWPEFRVRILARASLISAPIFNCWPSVIAPQPCVLFRVLHPERTIDDRRAFCAWRWVQHHVRFMPGATRLDGSPLSWVYSPTMKQLGVDDGGNAPLVIARDGRDPEQPGYETMCSCVIVCAGEWDALSVLLAAGWLDDNGILNLPSGLAIVGIRGEGRGGTDAYLRHYRHWKPRSVVMVADADRTGLTWFESQDGRPCFAAQLERRGAKVLRFIPASQKDVNDFYRTGDFGMRQVEAMLTKAGFPLSKGGPK